MFQVILCRPVPAGEDHLGKWPLQCFFPEYTPLLRVREMQFHPLTEICGVSREASICRRYHGFQTSPQQPCQYRRRASARNRDQNRGAVYDGRHDERTKIRIVHDIDRNVEFPGSFGNVPVDRRVAGSGNNQNSITQMIRTKGFGTMSDYPLGLFAQLLT